MRTHLHPSSKGLRKFGRRLVLAFIVLLSIAAPRWLNVIKDHAVTRFTASTESPGLRPPGTCIEDGLQFGRTILPGVTALTGSDLKPFQTKFERPELADPYVTLTKRSAIVSGTAQYFLKFGSVQDLRNGGPYQVIWSDFYYSDGTPMEGDRYHAHSWDMKPVLWSVSPNGKARLWDEEKDSQRPRIVWYGGHMRPRPGNATAEWPRDNYSRDVFAFEERDSGKWYSREESIFSKSGTWPRRDGSFLGHRYGHQMVMVPTLDKDRKAEAAAVFYEEVSQVRSDGSPSVTKIFMDTMIDPFQASGKPVALIDPINPENGRPYPSAIREDGSVLVEGPLYFRFRFEGEEWEAVGFSAGSFYGNYVSSFASRRVADGLQGKPYQLDLNDDGSDLHNAGAELGKVLGLAGGPGRPAVIIKPNGTAVPGPGNMLQVLTHGYRKDILPDNDYGRFPEKYRLDQMFRVVINTFLKVTKGPRGALRFQMHAPEGLKPSWTGFGPAIAEGKAPELGSQASN